MPNPIRSYFSRIVAHAFRQRAPLSPPQLQPAATKAAPQKQYDLVITTLFAEQCSANRNF